MYLSPHTVLIELQYDQLDKVYTVTLPLTATYDEIGGDGSFVINPAYISSNPTQGTVIT